MKPFLSWRDDWLLGLNVLDTQHLALAGRLNQIHGVMVAAGEKSEFNSDAYRRLLDFAEMAREHFRDEESVMRDQDFPGLGEHHREHALLLAELQDLIRHIEEGKRDFKLQTLTALKYWLIDHALNSDKAFADFCRQQAAPVAGVASTSRHTSVQIHNSIR